MECDKCGANAICQQCFQGSVCMQCLDSEEIPLHVRCLLMTLDESADALDQMQLSGVWYRTRDPDWEPFYAWRELALLYRKQNESNTLAIIQPASCRDMCRKLGKQIKATRRGRRRPAEVFEEGSHWHSVERGSPAYFLLPALEARGRRRSMHVSLGGAFLHALKPGFLDPPSDVGTKKLIQLLLLLF